MTNYRVPFVDVPTHFGRLRDQIMNVIEETLRQGNVVMRGELREFERNFAVYMGKQYAIGVGSGTDALHLALRAAGIGEGDEVVTVSHTCISTVSAIVHAGAVPILVDVCNDFNIDVDKVEEVLGPRTKAILPVHLNGRASAMARIMAMAQRWNLIVIEDAAQALGARYDGRLVGSFGAAGVFSLYPFKMLGAFGEAGIVVTDDPEIAQKVSILRDYGQDRDTGEILYFGFNSKLDNIQAAILNVKLQYLPQWIERRRTIAQLYNAGLSGIPQLRLPPCGCDAYFDVFLNYCVMTAQRDALVAHLRGRGVEPLLPISFAKPLHKHAALGLKHFQLPVTERIAGEFLYLPTNPELSDEQVEYAIECMQDFYTRREGGYGN